MRWPDRPTLWIAALAAIAASGCGGARSRMANAAATADVRPKDYGRAHTEWTRTEKVYDGLETKLLATATYRSAAFRDAYVDEYARRYLLSEPARDEMNAREHAEAERYHELFFAAYTGETRWNDFSKRTSIWKLRLFDDQGAYVEPLVVSKIPDDDPITRAFYPQFTPWTRGYLVKFPRPGLSEASKTLRLQVASAIGAAEMTFDRTKADTPAPARAEAEAGTAAR